MSSPRQHSTVRYGVRHFVLSTMISTGEHKKAKRLFTRIDISSNLRSIVRAFVSM
jgi:hypothetical protein